jgi:hypothetical protein
VSGHPDQTRAQIEALGPRDPADLARIAALEEEQRRDLADVERFRAMARGYMDERDEARAERDRLRDILACERGERAPEGWRWSSSAICSRGGGDTGEPYASISRGSVDAGRPSWRWFCVGKEGDAWTAIEAIEAADLAAKAAP